MCNRVAFCTTWASMWIMDWRGAANLDPGEQKREDGAGIKVGNEGGLD